MSNKKILLIVLLIIILAAASRLVKHPFNFTPIAAMALFSGAYLKNRWGILLPLAALLVSDYFIGFYDWQIMTSVYVSITLVFLIGKYISKRIKWQNVFLASLLSSVSFFIITNFAVWAFFPWYPHTFAGLASCFTMAIPFFKNTLAGDIVYSAALFGAFEFALFLAKKRNLQKSLTSIK